MGWQRVVRHVAQKFGVDITRYPPAFDTTSRDEIPRQLRDVERPLVLDVGANVGQSVLRYRNLLPGCEIHSFEPSPTAFQELQAVAGPDVRLMNVAVGSAPGSITLLENSSSYMTSVLPPGPSAWGTIVRSTDVPVITLDDYCEEQKIARVDLLKTDTQGYDLEVLRGARGIIEAGRVRLVLVELNFVEMYQEQPRFDKLLGFLLDRGFHLVWFYDMLWLGSRAGWCDALLAGPS